jgi:hypothetical protein
MGVVQLAPKDAAQLRVGERVAASSTDFGRSVTLTSLGTAPASALADVYVGRITSVSPSEVVLGIGSRSQAFGVDPSLAASLRSRVGKVVALDVPDGAHVKAMMATPTLAHLIAPNTGGAPFGTVVASSRNRLSVQLPNGDTRTLTGPVAGLHARVGSAVHLAPLDRTHVRVTAGAHVARLADADACVTVNATCSRSTKGRTVAVAPTSIAVRFPNGDVRTFLGLIPSGAPAGATATVSPIDATHSRVTVGAKAANLLDADACVTINAGCHTNVGSIRATGNNRTVVTLPDGSQTVMSGTLARASVDSPILLQPLDETHLVAMTGGSLGTVTAAGACVTLNDTCRSARTAPIGAPLPGSPGSPGAPGGQPGPGTRGGTDPQPVQDGTPAVDITGLVALAFSPNTCGNDGEFMARVDDATSHRPLAGTRVHLSGRFESTVTTGADGRAVIGRLPIGSYDATFARNGYRTTAPVAVTIGCTTVAVIDGHLAALRTSAASSATFSANAKRPDRAAALRLATTSTFCVRNGKGVECAKRD